jgi:hypothetical protein
MLPVDDIFDSPLGNRAGGLQNGIGKTGNGKEIVVEHGNESDYLKSKLWCVQLYPNTRLRIIYMPFCMIPGGWDFFS